MERDETQMPRGDFASGQPVLLLIPEPIWREWKMNGVDADSLTELEAEHGEALGYEFDWGQIIEEASDDGFTTGSDDPEGPVPMAICWHFVLSDVHGAFLERGGNLGELSDLATTILGELERSQRGLREDAREDVLPACITFDEGNNISAFGVCVHGESNVLLARQWVESFFIPAVLPMLIDRLRAENDAAFAENAAHPAWHWRKKLSFSASRSRAKRR